MEVNIINFKNEYEKHFYDLNIEWLNNFFEVEEYDHKILSNAKKYIIDKGGKIFFAVLGDKIIATVALMPTENELTYELTKMAVKPKYRNKGIGKKLLNKCIEFSNYNGYESIILYSNKKLKNAIHLYKLFGFEEIKMEIKSPYSRADIKMIKKFYYTLPFRALNTHAIAKKPKPTGTKPQPAISLYLNTPRAIKTTPKKIIIKVAQPNTVFLFIIFFIFSLLPLLSLLFLS